MRSLKNKMYFCHLEMFNRDVSVLNEVKVSLFKKV